ncbi:thiazole biosynthesis/tRNA modification protein ThiI [Candidatus Methanoperedens nitroreducens]|uniref:Probable tRNA sulfurtransferase n=1 Tax=Candidatus Methanoperedens nitratireducens TaxID=1392998 RepID=A0A062VBG5_9EURY|nr:tRNA uracil 4-sulfurtransferase ThiI [Candidatus Methanoperedens nitroreducens]KCZ73024.1 thiazole biosynthesis/tRNA modification protein ThiI [Candidatus Methanoperedens nitroreducens]MDJ1423032.1 tRNA uracil 4-sulfurtransferase ThiI [Candidatus Methanoperedens sp.]
MKNPNVILVRYDELALKSKRVRARYEQILIKNIKAMLNADGSSYSDISREMGRIFIHSDDPDALKSASKVFGVVSASPAYTCDPTLEAAAELSAEVADTIREDQSFAIRARRAGNHEFTSRDIAIACGDAVFEKVNKNIRVDLDNPDLEIFVELRQDKAYVFTGSIKGVGGLPMGTQGRMIALISGGIDSPVAAWLMMKRGCEIIPLYLNNSPFSDDTTRERAMQCIDVLQRWAPQKKFTIYEAPHGDNLLAFLSNCDNRLNCILCRRMMYRIAGEVLKLEGAHGIITGSSLGQVASQTSQNMLASMHGMEHPIYHPLIGLDKLEITDIARKIGTFEPSTRPATCCMAVPEYPSTAAKPQEVIDAEKQIDVPSLVDSMIRNIKRFTP